MFTPLVQRQTLQTLSVEAVRLAAEGQAQVQQEQARKQTFDAKMAEAMTDVADVEEADILRLAEREERRRHPGKEADRAEEEEGAAGASAPSPRHPAGDAASHLDLLA